MRGECGWRLGKPLVGLRETPPLRPAHMARSLVREIVPGSRLLPLPEAMLTHMRTAFAAGHTAALTVCGSWLCGPPLRQPQEG